MTEWSPVRSAILRVTDEIGRPRRGGRSCLYTCVNMESHNRNHDNLNINSIFKNINYICYIAQFLSAKMLEKRTVFQYNLSNNSEITLLITQFELKW